MNGWFFRGERGPVGPVQRDEIDRLIRADTVKPETLVWREDLSEWRRADATEIASSFVHSDAHVELLDPAPKTESKSTPSRADEEAYQKLFGSQKTMMPTEQRVSKPHTNHAIQSRRESIDHSRDRTRAPSGDPAYSIGPKEAFVQCLQKTFTYSGRASRPEYWWFQGIAIAIVFCMTIVDEGLGGLSAILLAFPILAAAVRRLHDAGYSGWWVIIGFIFWPALTVILTFNTSNLNNRYV